jgi:molybdate transport system ATP-binding protein
MSGTTSHTLLEVKEASFFHRQTLLFQQISWTIKENEQWVIIGPTGSGKTSLINAITGKYILRQGMVKYPLLEKFRPSPDAYLPLKNHIAVVSFGEDSALLSYSDFYYQQRFNAAQSEGIITAREFLEKSLPASVLQQKLTSICRMLGIEEILPLEFIKLSNGQTRKLRIAKAILANPRLLILDNPFIGLDIATRSDLHQILKKLIVEDRQLILTSTQADFPEGITHILELENMKIKGMFTREEYLQKNAVSLPYPSTDYAASALLLPPMPVPDFERAFRFTHVTVKYDEKIALQDITWTVKRGEKWALLGPNGSGKSTILSLINGDHPQAYANDIWLFDQPRGSGESIWDIKRRTGFVSPELHLYFKQHMTCLEVAATGYFDALYINTQLTDIQKDIIHKHFHFLQIPYLLQESFQAVSTGQQRLVLLIRSLIKQPQVIIWDEPYQALDEQHIRLSAQLLKLYCSDSTTLLFVSHYLQEIPDFVNNYLFLEKGKVSRMERR